MLVSTLMIHNIQSQHVYNTKHVDILLYIIAIEFDLKNLQKTNQVDRHVFCTSITEPFSIQQKINVSPYTLKAVTCSICITDIILKCLNVAWSCELRTLFRTFFSQLQTNHYSYSF